MPRIPELNDIVLTFDADETPDLADVEVRCKSISLRQARNLDGLTDADGNTMQLNDYFVDEIIQSWNFTDVEGKELPITMGAFDEMPPWVLPRMREEWMKGLLTPPKAS